MKPIKILILITMSIFVLAACSDDDSGPAEPTVSEYLDRDQAKAAFEYLNKVRVDPDAYSASIGVDLSAVEARDVLTWNNTLQEVAEAKALDLANRNYFAHVDPDGFGINYHMNKAGYPMRPEWTTDPKTNNFESLAANSRDNFSGQNFINQLIIDEDVPSLGHRKHLLGMGDWNASLTECGVAIARKQGTKYTNYLVYIIAKPGGMGKEIYVKPVVIP